jgi:transposase
MADYQMLGELLGLPNVTVLGYQMVGRERIEVQVGSSLAAAVCPECQHVSMQVHDTAEAHTLRDLPMWGRQCWLRYAPRRFTCAARRRPFVERVAWRSPGVSYTVRYGQHISGRTRPEDLAHVAETEGLSQDTVRAIFEQEAKKRSPSGATRL